MSNEIENTHIARVNTATPHLCAKNVHLYKPNTLLLNFSIYFFLKQENVFFFHMTCSFSYSYHHTHSHLGATTRYNQGLLLWSAEQLSTGLEHWSRSLAQEHLDSTGRDVCTSSLVYAEIGSSHMSPQLGLHVY